MRNTVVAFGALTFFAVSPAVAGSASHVIRDNQDGPTTVAMDTRISGDRQVLNTMTLAYAPSQAHGVKPAFNQNKSHVIGGDN